MASLSVVTAQSLNIPRSIYYYIPRYITLLPTSYINGPQFEAPVQSATDVASHL